MIAITQICLPFALFWDMTRSKDADLYDDDSVTSSTKLCDTDPSDADIIYRAVLLVFVSYLGKLNAAPYH